MASEPKDKDQQIADENREIRNLRGPETDDTRADDIETRRSDDGAGEADDIETRRKPLQSGKYQDRREEIAQKAKALRDERNDPELAGDMAEHRARMFGRNVDQPDLRTEEPGDEPPVKHKLKVNGQEIEVDHDKLVEHAQRSIAAEGILEAAKRERDEATSLLQQLREAKGTAGDTNQPAAAAPKPKTEARTDTNVSDSEMDEIIDKIQVGDPKEAKAALQKFGDGIIDRVVARIGNIDETVEKTVEHINEANQRRRDTATTLEAFAKENPAIANSRRLQSALATATSDTMREKMTAIGVRDDVIERLQAERGLTEIEAVTYAYRSLREQNYDLPAHTEILKESARALSDEVRKAYGLPDTPAARTEQRREPGNHNFTQDRIERKRVMNPQPRRATTPSAMDQIERSREEKQLAAVRQMRAQRRGGRV